LKKHPSETPPKQPESTTICARKSTSICTSKYATMRATTPAEDMFPSSVEEAVSRPGQSQNRAMRRRRQGWAKPTAQRREQSERSLRGRGNARCSNVRDRFSSDKEWVDTVVQPPRQPIPHCQSDNLCFQKIKVKNNPARTPLVIAFLLKEFHGKILQQPKKYIKAIKPSATKLSYFQRTISTKMVTSAENTNRATHNNKFTPLLVLVSPTLAMLLISKCSFLEGMG